MTDTQNDTSELELEQILLDYLSWAYEIGLKDGTGLAEVRKEATEELLTLIAQREQAAELRGRIDEQLRTGSTTHKADVVFYQHEGSTYITQEKRIEKLQATKPEKEN